MSAVATPVLEVDLTLSGAALHDFAVDRPCDVLGREMPVRMVAHAVQAHVVAVGGEGADDPGKGRPPGQHLVDLHPDLLVAADMAAGFGTEGVGDHWANPSGRRGLVTSFQARAPRPHRGLDNMASHAGPVRRLPDVQIAASG